MYSSWIPQNIQKRLLLYILQQLSLFSEVDLPNLEEVSLNNIHLRSVSIDPEKFDKIPGFRLRHGTIKDFILTGGVVDGVNVDISGVDLVVAPSFDNIKQDIKDVENSLAQSTAELSQAIIKDSAVLESESAISSGEALPLEQPSETSNESPADQRRSSFSGGVMTKALDMALLRIRVMVKEIKIKVVIDFIDLEFSIDKISFDSKNGMRSLSFLGMSVSTLKPNVNPGNRASGSTTPAGSLESSDSESTSESESEPDTDLMESKVFSKEEASSIYMSAISLQFGKPSVSVSETPERRVLLVYIDKIDAEFEKLVPVSDMRLGIGTISIAAVPLLPTLSLILNSLSKTVKLKNHLLRKTNFAQRSSRTKADFVPSELNEATSTEQSNRIFDTLRIECLRIGVTSALTHQGTFASIDDDLEFIVKNFTVKQKGTDLIYGGVESLRALKHFKGTEFTMFHFENLDTGDDASEASSNTKAEVRFEYSKKKAKTPDEINDSELAILLHKPGKFECDVSSLRYLLNLVTAINQLNEGMSVLMKDLRQLSELTRPDARSKTQWNGTFKEQDPKVGKSQVLLQTASLEIMLLLLQNTTLKTLIYPISFDNLRDHLLIHRVVSSIIKDGKATEVMTIPRISLRLEPKEFQAFKFSAGREVPEKTTLTGSLSIQIGDIEASIDHEIFEAIVAESKAFFAALQLRNECINCVDALDKTFPDDQSESKTFTRSLLMNPSRTVRGAVQMNFGERKWNQAKFKLSVKLARIKIKNILNEFGDVDICLLDSLLYQLSVGMIGHVNQVEICRVLDGKKEMIVSSCLDDAYPMIHFSHSDSRPAPEIVFRRIQIDYYTKLLRDMQEFKQTNQKSTVGLNTSASQGSDNIISGTNTESKNRDNGNLEVHGTSHNLVIGITPLRLPSKLCCAITKGTVNISISKMGILLKHTFRDVNILLIDEVSKFRASKTDRNLRLLTQFMSGGYSILGLVSTLHLGLNILPSEQAKFKPNSSDENSTLDVKINIDSVRLSLCADSFHALIQTATDLKIPVVFSEEDRSKTTVNPDFEWPQDIKDELASIGKNGFFSAEHRLSSDEVREPVNSATQFNVVDEYCNAAKPRDILSNNLNSVTESASESEKNASSLEFAEGHFYQKEGGSVTPDLTLLFKLNISKTEVYLHDGYDWKSTRKSLAGSIKALKKRAGEFKEKKFGAEGKFTEASLPESQSHNLSSSGSNVNSDEEDGPSQVSDTLFKSIHISADVNTDASNLVELINYQLQGDSAKEAHTNVDVQGRIKDLRLKRSSTHKAKIEVKNLSTGFQNYTNRDPRFDPTPPDLKVELLNKLELGIDDLTIFDNVATSSWNKFLTYMSILGDRELGMKMVDLAITNVRPDASLAFAEALIEVKILPVRLYIDQDTLSFFSRFMEFRDSRFAQPVEDPMYVQKLDIDALRVKFDYKPKKIDFNGIRAGKNAELANFFALDGSDLSLTRAVVYGVQGFPKVSEELGRIYTPYIRKSQISGILSGLPPVKSIFNFKDGVRDLVTIPLKEYKRDGRLLYGIQKGTKSFAKITTNELLRIGVKLASGTQVFLENLEEYFGGEGTTARRYVPSKKEKREPVAASPQKLGKKNLLETSQILKNSISGDVDLNHKPKRYLQASIDEDAEDDIPHNDFDTTAFGSMHTGLSDLQSSVLLLDDSEEEILSEDSFDEGEASEHLHRKATSLYSNQPTNSGEGLKSAYASLGRNLSKTRRKLVDLKEELRDADSYQEQLTSIAKSSPVLIIRPIIGTTEAVMKTLMGVSNGIDSRLLIENHDKYRSDDLLHDG